jgi:NodT family efflux transporter outer membrane factor (OMF) lipoprotein
VITTKGMKRTKRSKKTHWFFVSFVSFVCFVSFVVGCAPKTQYVAPETPTVPAFKENANWKPAEPRDADIRGTWWELFGDPQLNDLEARIDVSNQTLRAVVAQFEQARALVHGARANLGPQVGFNPAIVGARPSGERAISSFHDPYLDVLLPLTASYEVDVWGRLHGIVAANTALAQASAADIEAARLSIHAELAVDYFTLRGLDSEAALLNNSVAAYQQALDLTQNRFRGGLASQADVAQAETQLETTRAQAIDIGVGRQQIEHAIAVLVGQPASTFSIPVAPRDLEPPGVPVAIPTTLLERRPDIAAAERRVASASAQIGVANSAFYPILTLSGSVGFEASTFGSLLTGPGAFWAIGPQLLVNVFDNGRRRAVKEQAIAAYNQSAANYQESVLGAFRDVEDNLSALRILDEESRVQANAVAASERSLTLANNRYRGGVASYLDVIIAQSFALQNQRAAVNIQMRRMSATVLLLKALGGGWNVSTLPAITGRADQGLKAKG